MSYLYRITEDRATVLKVDGKAGIKPTPWISELGAKSVTDGVEVVDSDCHLDIKDIRGTALHIILKDNPAFNKLQAMVVSPKIVCCYDGIVCDAADANLAWARVCSFRGIGAWLKSGNIKMIGGHIYGGDEAIRVGGDPKYSGRCSLTGVDFSDTRIGLRLLTATSVIGGYSQHCWERGILVGYQSSISNTDILVEPTFVGASPVGIEFAVRVDKDLNIGLNGNWSSYTGNITVGGGVGYTGIILDTSYTHIQASITGRGAGSTALVSNQTINSCTIDLDVCDCPGGIRFSQLGNSNLIQIKSNLPNLQLPATWNESNRIEFNGWTVKPGEYVGT